MTADGPALPRGLSPAQRDAVLAPEPIVCVLAAAGAGKTRVLTLRVARRVGDGTALADHTLVCTFSRKAATELRDRLWALGVGADVEAGTIHRTALRLLQQYRADRRRTPPAVLGDRRALVAEVLAGAPGGAAGRAAVRRVEGEIGWAKARLLRPDDYEAAARAAARRVPMPAGAVAGAYARYEEARRRRGLLDLDDLLTACADTLAEDTAFADAVRWRFRHLYVDEMQDVNPAQFRLLAALLGDEPDLFVVGDPHQSVYGWNGADPTLLHRLPEILGGTRVLRLDANHRSSRQVVAVAAAALGLGGAGGPTSARGEGAVPRLADHPTDRDEARAVARQIWLAHRPGRRWSSTAVLARTNAQLRALAEALARERVPFRLAGEDLAPASDLSTRGGGDIDDGGDGAGGDGDAADGDRDLADGDAGAPVVGEAEGTSGTPAPAGGDGVTLSTFHRAKGLQWPSVFVVGLSEGLVPLASARSAAALAEERRLLYVAMTRAEDDLALSWARRAAPGAPARRPSRWLDDVAATIERLGAAPATADPAEAVAHLRALRAQLAARAKGDRG